MPGWKTDRGRIYILYGEPDGKESHPSGGSYQREFYEGGGQTSVYPFERWRYRHIDGVGDDVELEFVDKTFTNEYRLAMDSEEKDALLTVPNAGLTHNEEMGISKKEDRVNYGYLSQTNFQRSKDAPFERLARYFNVQKPPRSSLPISRRSSPRGSPTTSFHSCGGRTSSSFPPQRFWSRSPSSWTTGISNSRRKCSSTAPA